MNAECKLRLAPLAKDTALSKQLGRQGYLVRLDGRGRMFQSLGFKELVRRLLADESRVVVVNLSECEYLDSTYLGCLLGLHQSYSGAGSPRFLLYAPPAQRKKLFGPMRLEKVFAFLDTAPEEGAPLTSVAFEARGDREYGLHVLESHDRLAHHDCPDAPAFERIVRQLERELSSDEK